MEITTTEILITTSLAVIGFGFLIYKIYIVPTPIPEAIEPIVQSTEPLAQIIEQAINNPVLVVPTSNDEINLLLNIFRGNPVYTSAYQSLLRYRDIYNRGDIARDVLYNSPFQYATENEKINELFRRLENTPEWLNIVNILKETPPSHQLLEAIVNRDLEITVASAEAIAEEITSYAEGIDVPSAEEIAIPSNSFHNFFTSEFGIKCMVAGSIVVVTAIIIHLLVVYYYKTTYTAIVYKSMSWVPKLIKILKGFSLK